LISQTKKDRFVFSGSHLNALSQVKSTPAHFPPGYLSYNRKQGKDSINLYEFLRKN
jgi:hypothetical protein